MIQTGTSKNPNIVHLIRLLFLTTARYNFIVSAVHVLVKKNAIADALPRFRLQEFSRLVPTAFPSPTVIHTTATRAIYIEALEERALNLMANGIAASTRRTNTTAQRRFIAFCYQTKRLAPSGFPCPASERTPMLFAAHLAALMKDLDQSLHGGFSIASCRAGNSKPLRQSLAPRTCP